MIREATGSPRRGGPPSTPRPRQLSWWWQAQPAIPPSPSETPTARHTCLPRPLVRARLPRLSSSDGALPARHGRRARISGSRRSRGAIERLLLALRARLAAGEVVAAWMLICTAPRPPRRRAPGPAGFCDPDSSRRRPLARIAGRRARRARARCRCRVRRRSAETLRRRPDEVDEQRLTSARPPGLIRRSSRSSPPQPRRRRRAAPRPTRARVALLVAERGFELIEHDARAVVPSRAAGGAVRCSAGGELDAAKRS